ncbi:SAM-dependent methyltransferase [Actinomadura sp. 6K520]|uniref:SAM-dependent methyltransferase n=1 Tax=Actinomadura sp. 6K520 TaxID=2530364 RepID=UPI00104CA419|nr:SAM-dependent methyltransferase [Actinomadura sp. 6K520]TDE32378.1 SAM-dependent methyltransferase [Actinomadura sp. 6K520]
MAWRGARAMNLHAVGSRRREVGGYVPNVARMHNYLLDGKDHYAADRSAVRDLLEHAPELYRLARAERLFLMRGVRWLAWKAGIDQFLDLGCGMPVGRSVHESAAGAAGPGRRPRVVYVDNDPVVVAHGRALLDEGDSVLTVPGDVRDPKRLLRESRVADILDFRRPVAVLCGAVLPHLDGERPGEVVAALRDVLAPGSALLVSHLCGDHAAPHITGMLQEVYATATAPLTLRSREQIAGLFDGFDLPQPGVTDVARWPRTRPPAGRRTITSYGGIARRPGG